MKILKTFICLCCGAEQPQTSPGRPKEYCGTICKEYGPRPAMTEYESNKKCVECDRWFLANGHQLRRYCSRKCQSAAARRASRPIINARRRKERLKKFGLTIEQYDQLLTSQKGRCAICQGLPDPKRRLAVDHDHTTNRIRGLLCFACNSLIGKARDDSGILQLAVDYLDAAA